MFQTHELIQKVFHLNIKYIYSLFRLHETNIEQIWQFWCARNPYGTIDSKILFQDGLRKILSFFSTYNIRSNSLTEDTLSRDYLKDPVTKYQRNPKHWAEISDEKAKWWQLPSSFSHKTFEDFLFLSLVSLLLIKSCSIISVLFLQYFLPPSNSDSTCSSNNSPNNNPATIAGNTVVHNDGEEHLVLGEDEGGLGDVDEYPRGGHHLPDQELPRIHHQLPNHLISWPEYVAPFTKTVHNWFPPKKSRILASKSFYQRIWSLVPPLSLLGRHWGAVRHDEGSLGLSGAQSGRARAKLNSTKRPQRPLGAQEAACQY